MKSSIPSVVEKAAALAVSLLRNRPFVDGNKRVAHGGMEVFLVLNGREIEASVYEQERLMLGLAAGDLGREELAGWLSADVAGQGLEPYNHALHRTVSGGALIGRCVSLAHHGA